MTKLEPKLLSVFREGYTKALLRGDILGGLTVGIVALPLAIALAIASGVKPEQGLYTAIFAGFTIALLGGTRTGISGPTGAFIVIVYGIVEKYGYDGLAVATLMAGVLLILMGLARMGAFLKFVPYPVTVGFTSAIALIIFSSQVSEFVGLKIDKVPADFVEKWVEYVRHLHTADVYTVAVGGSSLLIIILWNKWVKRIPGQLIAILVVTFVVQFFDLPVQTIETRFGNVPSGLPSPHLPNISFEMVQQLFMPAVTIALLAGLESLLSAVVADGMTGARHRSNMELIAQGSGNIVSIIFGGIPATGAIARTATNIKSGGKTPVAALIHSIFLLLVLLFIGKWAALIPMATLAAVLIIVAYNMSEWREFVHLLKSPRGDVVVLLVTFLLTVFIDLTVAIQIGILLAAFLFLQKMSSETSASLITENLKDDEEFKARDMSAVEIPKGVEVFEIYGSLFFGAVRQFKESIRVVAKRPKVIILRMRQVPTIDASGIHVLEELAAEARENGQLLIFSAVSRGVYRVMRQSGFVETVGRDSFAPDIFVALERAEAVLKDRVSK
ncbi:MAG: sulfate transporter [Acidobacteria bacterium OLB17]|nr:MAG: sulfate transporter [Acidobacteria bacterium OLB17]MCZ2390151.1 sulfate permease [Acidobacteriota bacterium]